MATLSLPALAADTWRALAAPRRAGPILAVAVPLIATQWLIARELAAAAVAVGLCGVFVALGPLVWRALLAPDQASGRWGLRAGLYGLITVVLVVATSQLLERIAGLPKTFLTSLPNMAVMAGLFGVGGWGLGRDIELEARLARSEARAARLEREREHAQLLAIRSHLDPHFLFNTLNAIAEWTREDPRVAEQAIVQLAGLLRTVLGALREPRWPLAQELALVSGVLDLHQIRDPERFAVERLDWDPVPDAQVPPMLLLPLVENAMTHGPAKGHRGHVRVAVRREGARIVLEVENPGTFAGERPGGEGLAMVRRRLALTWGDQAGLEIGSPVAGRTRARVWFPREAG